MPTASHINWSSTMSPSQVTIDPPIQPCTLAESPAAGPLPMPAPSGPPLRWGVNSLGPATDDVSWIWQGLIAPGSVTLLTSQWKVGKTTLAAMLLARMKAGGELAGRKVIAGQALVISEESEEQWRRRARKLGIDHHVGWFCRPFRSRPRPDEWRALLERIPGVHDQHRLSLVLIDPLAAFVCGSENDAGCMLETLTAIKVLTDQGLGVLMLHHPSKGRVLAGQAARGSGALSGYVDILVEMRASAAPEDRRRRLRAYSRFEETPRRLVMELSADGTDYQAIDPGEPALGPRQLDQLRALLESAPAKLPAVDLLLRWPAEPVPRLRTLQRLLNRAVAEGHVCRDGTGRRHDPFRYWLLGQEERWARDPLAFVELPPDIN
jgi:hypothetical protein